MVVKKIDRDNNDHEINVYIENPNNLNYYILAPQCEISGDDYYINGKLDSADFLISESLNNVVVDIYKNKKESISVVLIPAKKTKKLNFKFDKNKGWYSNTNVYFPFNIKHSKLKSLTEKLKLEKIIPEYSFYSDSIINKVK